MQTQLFFADLRGRHSRHKICWTYNFDLIAGTEKYYFRIISAMNSDKRYFGSAFLCVLSATFILSRNSHILDAKSRLKSKSQLISAKIGKKWPKLNSNSTQKSTKSQLRSTK